MITHWSATGGLSVSSRSWCSSSLLNRADSLFQLLAPAPCIWTHTHGVIGQSGDMVDAFKHWRQWLPLIVVAEDIFVGSHPKWLQLFHILSWPSGKQRWPPHPQELDSHHSPPLWPATAAKINTINVLCSHLVHPVDTTDCKKTTRVAKTNHIKKTNTQIAEAEHVYERVQWYTWIVIPYQCLFWHEERSY